MELLNKIRENEYYSIVKENNSLLIFLLTICGGLFTFIYKSVLNLFYRQQLKSLNIPENIINGVIRSKSDSTVTICFIILFITSTIALFFFYQVFFRIIKEIRHKNASAASFIVLAPLCLFLTVTYCIIIKFSIKNHVK